MYNVYVCIYIKVLTQAMKVWTLIWGVPKTITERTVERLL